MPSRLQFVFTVVTVAVNVNAIKLLFIGLLSSLLLIIANKLLGRNDNDSA